MVLSVCPLSSYSIGLGRIYVELYSHIITEGFTCVITETRITRVEETPIILEIESLER